MPNLIVSDVPLHVREALARDAAQRNVSLNDAAVGILADAYGTRREPTGAPFRQEPQTASLLLSMPAALHRKVKIAAAAKSATMRGIVIVALAEHYGVPAPSAARRPRTT